MVLQGTKKRKRKSANTLGPVAELVSKYGDYFVLRNLLEESVVQDDALREILEIEWR